MDETSQKTIVNVKNEEPEKEIEPGVKRINGKKLKKIRHQMEFYFSDANLSKDRMLGRMIQDSADRYVDLRIFMSFNRIKCMTECIEDLIKAVSQSNKLEIDESKTKVRRTFPFLSPKRDTEALTVYVEKIPPDADHKFIKNVFQRFGKVAYISIPTFRNSDMNKGFSFVEFESEESVKLACEAYKELDEEENENATHSDASVDLEKEDGIVIDNPKEINTESKCRKRKISEKNEEPTQKVLKVEQNIEESCNEDSSKSQKREHLSAKLVKKRKRRSSECSTPSKKGKTVTLSDDSKECVSTSHSSGVMDRKLEENVAEPPLSSDTLEIPGNKSLEDSETPIGNEKETCTAVQEVTGVERKAKRRRKKAAPSEKLKLRVITIPEWKVYRNRYLSMQRKAMSAIKKMLMIDQQQQQKKCESVLQHPPSTEQKGHEARSPNAQASQSRNGHVEFSEGVILKVSLSDIPENFDPKDFREQLRGSVKDVAYVDATALQDSNIYIRFYNSESSSAAMTNELLKKIGNCEILSGEEETAYWEKLKHDRTAQRNRQRPKIRGRDKILAKSAKFLERKNTHIFFNN